MTGAHRTLVTGDIIAIAVVTLLGFASHGELKVEFLTRMFAAWIPLTVAWFILAPWFELFQSKIISDPRQLWRPTLVMIFAASLAGVLRGLILQAEVAPIFIVVFGATSAFGITIWRGAYLFFSHKL